MKAILARRYGAPDVLAIEEVPAPSPGKKEVRIKLHATTVTSADSRMRSLTMPLGFGLLSRLMLGLSRPRQPILGSELAGEIVEVGSAVSEWRVGDEVVAFSDTGMGCHAEYKTLPEDAAIVHKPTELTAEQAATLSFGGTTALHFLRRASVQPGEAVLINGATGNVGSAAVQLARYFGADVTAVCSTDNLALATDLGAHRTIDYTQADFADGDDTFDVILDMTGKLPVTRALQCLRSRGRLLLVAASLPDMLRIPWLALTTGKAIIAGPAGGTRTDLQFVTKLASARHLRPVVDRSYPLDQAAAAHRYVDAGHKRGSVVLSFN